MESNYYFCVYVPALSLSFVVDNRTFSYKLVDQTKSTILVVLWTWRKCTFTRKRSKPWSTPYQVQRLTTSYFGLRLHLLIATSVKASYGGSLDKAWDARNVVSNAMKSAKIFSTRIVCKVRTNFWFVFYSEKVEESKRVFETLRDSLYWDL